MKSPITKILFLFVIFKGALSLQHRLRLSPLDQLKLSATRIESTFQKHQMDKKFGKGLDPQLVDDIRKSSTSFWEMLKGLQQSDVADLSDEDGTFTFIILVFFLNTLSHALYATI